MPRPAPVTITTAPLRSVMVGIVARISFNVNVDIEQVPSVERNDVLLDGWIDAPMSDTLDDHAVLVTCDTHVGPRLIEDLRPYCPQGSLADFDEFAEDTRPVREWWLGADAPGSRLAGHYDSAARRKDMEGDGVVAEVLFHFSFNGELLPFIPSFTHSDNPSDPELAKVGMRIYNRWLADFCAELPGRRAGLRAAVERRRGQRPGADHALGGGQPDRDEPPGAADARGGRAGRPAGDPPVHLRQDLRPPPRPQAGDDRDGRPLAAAADGRDGQRLPGDSAEQRQEGHRRADPQRQPGRVAGRAGQMEGLRG